MALFTFFLGLLVAPLLEFWKTILVRPYLHIEFEPNEPGMIVPVDTGAGPGRYIRLKVLNEGITSAKNVGVHVTSITAAAVGRDKAKYDTEVLDLKWALGGTEERHIAPHTFRYIDLAHIVTGNEVLDFDFYVLPHYLPIRHFGPGTYRIVVTAHGENCRPFSCAITLKWTRMEDIKLICLRRIYGRC